MMIRINTFFIYIFYEDLRFDVTVNESSNNNRRDKKSRRKHSREDASNLPKTAYLCVKAMRPYLRLKR